MAGLYDMAKMTVSGAPGTGTITLLAAVAGFQTFASAGVPTGQTVSYSAIDGSLWEVGRGVYTSSGTTLSRGSLFSSAGGTAVSLTSSAQVWIAILAEDLQPAPATGITAAGTTQGTATVLTTRESYVSSVPTANFGVQIPGSLPILIVNEDPFNTLDIWPATGVSINALAANTSVTLAAGFAMEFRVKSATLLRTIP